jgi:hypothetical protein
MSNGINAIKGFDYQATVTRDLLFKHFDSKGPSARARPEGHEDIDLTWQEGSVERRHYFQIKKPREDNQGHLKPRPWTLVEAVDELLPNTIRNLRGNLYEQTWIVGDVVADDLQSLLDSGADAPARVAETYWTALHLLVRDEIIKKSNLAKPRRDRLLRWRPVVDRQATPADVLQSLIRTFGDEITSSGAPSTIADRYRDRVTELHQCLPDVLSRTLVMAAYGTEPGVTARVYAELEQRYGLQRSVIENTLFRNLHGFITDISKQPGRSFDNTEFELELRTVWPQMIPIRDVPSLSPSHIRRPDLADRFTTSWTGGATGAVGISGSGKTMLAAEVAEQSLAVDPARLVYYAEVRPDTELRDVLVGLSFHLHRWGLTAPFIKSVEIGPPDEEVIEELGRLLPFLLQRRHRDTLRPALSFLARDPELETAARGGRSRQVPSLQIGSREDAVEFLASLPDVDYNGMVASRSSLLGRLGGVIWSKRKELRAFCLKILKEATEDEKIIAGAIRVLVFLGESVVWELSEPLIKRQGKIGPLAALVPAMLPGVCDQSRYEARVLDTGLPLEGRTAALHVLALAGADLGPLFRRVVEEEKNTDSLNALRVMFLLACVHAPFSDGVSLVDEAMKSNNPNAVPIITAALARLAELPDPKVTDLLIEALSNPAVQIRQTAVSMLAARRSRKALPYLQAQFANEDQILRPSLAGAIVASGPSMLADMHSARPDTPDTRLWRCILAMRVRDATAADEMVSIAIDSDQNWQLRRAAIFAAGRMPYDVALAKIIPVVMQQQTSLALDKSEIRRLRRRRSRLTFQAKPQQRRRSRSSIMTTLSGSCPGLVRHSILIVRSSCGY